MEGEGWVKGEGCRVGNGRWGAGGGRAPVGDGG